MLAGLPADAARLQRYRDLGLARVVVALPSEKRDRILPLLDYWAGLIRRFAK